jgi:DTW domain-containing protein YfiP
MAATRCPTCLAPLDFCYCDEVRRVPSRVPIVVVRHASERVKVSNTGGLAARIVGGRVVEHGGWEGPMPIGDLGPTPHLLFTGGRETDWPVPSALVVLDATWRQVRGMRARVPGLLGMPILSLPPAASRLRMREQHLPEGMSTIEAVAAALSLLGEDEPARALFDAYELMTARWMELRQHPNRRR